MDIETMEQRTPRVVSMIHEHWDFERALADFRIHRHPGRALEPVQRVSIPLQALGTCNVDRRRTEQVAAIAVSERLRNELQKKGVRLQYPVICGGDPFYLVYFIRRDKIEWIWKFEVSAGGLDLIWSFDAGTQQRKIPELAAENLSKDDFWYQPPWK